MTLEKIYNEAKTDWENQEYLLVDEYDDDNNLITILKDEDGVYVHLHDVKDKRHSYHRMTNKEFHILDFGNFTRLINELHYYAQ